MKKKKSPDVSDHREENHSDRKKSVMNMFELSTCAADEDPEIIEALLEQC